MICVFRADSSLTLGSGHVVRCLTLADALKSRGCQVFFVIQNLAGEMSQYIQSRGYEFFKIPDHAGNLNADAQATKSLLQAGGIRPDWLIIDHYQIGIEWESYLRDQTHRIAVIDDLADRSHDCDLLLDQNTADNRYSLLISRHSLQLLGPSYALLRTDFHRYRQQGLCRKEALRNLLIFFSGSDATQETRKSLTAVIGSSLSIQNIHVVIGSNYPDPQGLHTLCRRFPHIQLHTQVPHMAQLMYEADVALGSFGAATWERCSVGLPVVGTVLADNQVMPAKIVTDQDAGLNLGRAADVNGQAYVDALKSLSSDRLNEISKKSAQLVDGKGTERVVAHLITLGDRK